MTAKILDIEDLRAELAERRREGRTIAFANGCFDLLHVGHLRYLKGAKEQADLLVVALNDDASVRQLKGDGRPLQPDDERAELLAAFEPVDYVVVFSGSSPSHVLEDLKPDVHCKGTDYGSPENVPEYAVVRAYGGRTALVGDPKDHATSDLVGQIKELD